MYIVPIFYRNPVKYNGQALSVYTREEQHSEGCVTYYRDKTRPASSEEERQACAALIAHYTQYCAKYGDEALTIHARLRNN